MTRIGIDKWRFDMEIRGRIIGWAIMLGITMGWGSQAHAEFPAGMTLTNAEQSAAGFRSS
jgi:hypothetical protein